MSDPLPEGFDRDAWRAKHWNFANENVPKWFDAVRAKYGKETTKYACTGYCFGAPFVCNLLAGDGISAGAFAHPTSLKEEHFMNLKRECGEARADPEALSVALRSVLTRRRAEPLLLSCAENDHAFETDSRRKAIDILQGEKKTYHLQLFQGVSHGFAVKGDPADPYQSMTHIQNGRNVLRDR